MFSKGGSNKVLARPGRDVGADGDDGKTAEDKRKASRRNTILKQALDYVQQRWSENCNLHPRKEELLSKEKTNEELSDYIN